MTERTRIDLGRVRTPSGFFLPVSAPDEPFVAAPPADRHYRHHFTYRGSAESIRQAAVELIRSARRKIFLASFRIGDRRIIDALVDAVERLRGGVYVVTSWNESTLRRGLAELDDLDADDVAVQKKQFDSLTRRGIALRGHEQCHAKFLVVDDERALVSSANLETSALADRPERAATGESGVVLTDAVEVRRLARFFTRMWFAGCTWEVTPGTEYALRQRAPVDAPVIVTPSTGPHGVVWTDGNEHGILTTLHDVIGRARHELLLATFGLVGVRDRPEMLLDPLRRAIREHGVDVRLLVRARNNIADHRRDTAALAEAGVRIHADSYTHAKGVVADGRHGALFSANLDASHGLYDGVEVGVRLDHRPVLTEARRYLLHAMAHADRRFEPQPTGRALDAGLRAAWQTRWRGRARITVAASDADWRTLTEAVEWGPVLWTDDGVLRLHAADRVFTLNGPTRRLRVTRADEPALDRMNRWYGLRGEGSGTRRGVCPAVLVRA
ncbi:hypothetical protein CA850_01495 [Micromonospora echinospora]|uniref:Putative cardiolipin synthase n=1 Tax=Micromonospora echinospora TaxID=1877 RepID=A0A1C4Y9U4_MICEC|nr:phosphatidylserine/phosphatidylglycerophosphate/cardiolipin synthase family protein [Micromonospora echinospora]OZV84552.1 hypothetical protein CA850_01495 [Micromonospora echinospora]SCF17440.1 putative cardiolipin synthase [Micromonospora echinospora]